MPKFALKMRGTLSNIEELSAPPDPDFRWHMKFACNGCGEKTEKFHYVSAGESVPGRKRGSANMEMKCKFCSRETTVNILEDYVAPYVASDGEDFQRIAAVECRGSLEPVEFSPRGGWIAKTVDGGTTFTDVDLSDEWSDYCEKVDKPVAIYGLEFAFEPCN